MGNLPYIMGVRWKTIFSLVYVQYIIYYLYIMDVILISYYVLPAAYNLTPTKGVLGALDSRSIRHTNTNIFTNKTACCA